MNNYIHWYPGHIAKAEKELKKNLSRVDILLEVIDARIPVSSAYRNLNELIGNKPKIVLLNKSDLSDPEKNKIWKKKIEEKYGCPCLLTTATNQRDVKTIVEKILNRAEFVFEKLKARGLLPRPVRVMVIGMPNVGKSSIINKLTGQSKTKTGAKAGVTRNQQWVRVHGKIELLDTPGIIPTVQEDQKKAVRLAMVNSVSENAYDSEYAAEELLKILTEKYNLKTKEYYGLCDMEITLENIAKKRNWIIKNAKPDMVRTAQFVLTNFRNGKIGKITLDEPEDF